VDATRANTGELGLGEPTPVGTFESGRRAQGWPYDLVGNVSEWTETVPASWCSVVALSAAAAEEDIKADQRPQLAWLFEVLYGGPPDEQWLERLVFYGDPRFLEVADVVEMSWSFARGRREALRSAALAVWQQAGGLLPAVFGVAGAGAEVPHEVVGADFLTSMDPEVTPGLVESVPAGDRRLRTGLRLCTTPRELLRALVVAEVTPTALDFEQLRRFVRRDRHHAVLAAAWPDVARQASEAELIRPLGRWLSGQLVPRTGQ